jgi:conjugative transfer signal peptidase TraF
MKRPKLGRNWKIGFIVLTAMAMASTAGNRQIVINTSPSVPPGLYVRSTEPPRVGAIVDFRIPPSARQYVFARAGNSGEDWYILKPIVAGPGDRVDTMGERLVINGRPIAPMPSRKDDGGRRLPLWRQNRVLAEDEFFVFSGRIANSFDSRCYGPLHRQQIEAVRRAVITW